jgi:hypothetical protein
VKDINDLLNQWQDSVENAQPDVEDSIKEEELRQLYEVAGMRVRTGTVAGYHPTDQSYCSCYVPVCNC